MKKKSLDTMLASTNFCQLPGGRGKSFKYPTLSELNEKLFREKVDNAHNASADVEATARCFLELIRIGVFTKKDLHTNDEYLKVFKEANPKPFELIGLNIKPYAADDFEESELEDTDDTPSKKRAERKQKAAGGIPVCAPA